MTAVRKNDRIVSTSRARFASLAVALVLVLLAFISLALAYFYGDAINTSKRLSQRNACITNVNNKHTTALDDVVLNAIDNLPQQQARDALERAKDQLVRINDLCPPVN
jgi:hypothetical protein